MSRGDKRLANPTTTRGRTPRVGIAAPRLKPTVVEEIRLRRAANDNEPPRRAWRQQMVGIGALLVLAALLTAVVALSG